MVQRLRLMREGIARPLLSFLPLLACLPFWRRLSMLPLSVPLSPLGRGDCSILWWIVLPPTTADR